MRATSADFLGLVVQDSEVARILREGMADRSSLSEDDMQRFDALLGMQFAAFNQEYQFVSDGVMGPAIWKHRIRTMRRMLPVPGFRQWWTDWGDLYPEEFQNLVDGLIREGEAAG